MKKLLLALVAILSAVCILPTVALAQTQQEREIETYVQSQDKVAVAKCIVCDNVCVVALKTERFTTKLEYKKFREQVENNLKQKYNFEQVIVTRSPKTMHIVEQLAEMDETKRQEELQKLIELHNKKFEIQPR